jgi:hypothetical protein
VTKLRQTNWLASTNALESDHSEDVRSPRQHAQSNAFDKLHWPERAKLRDEWFCEKARYFQFAVTSVRPFARGGDESGMARDESKVWERFPWSAVGAPFELKKTKKECSVKIPETIAGARSS